MVTMNSCFEIIEEVNLNNDGTGSVMYTLNLSQSKMKINQILRLDSINGYKVPSREEIGDTIASYFSQVNNIEGLSNYQKTEDFENMIFTFACDFENLKALNQLAHSMNQSKRNDPNLDKDHYIYTKETSTYTRAGNYNLKNEFDNLRVADRAIFTGARLISIFRSESEIVELKNPKAILSPSKKAVMLKLQVLDIINNRKDLSNSIILKQQ